MRYYWDSNHDRPSAYIPSSKQRKL